LGWNIS